MSGRPRAASPGDAPGGGKLHLLRTGIAVALTAAAVSVHFRDSSYLPESALALLFAAFGVYFGAVIVRSALAGNRALPLPFAALQAAADVGFVSVVVYGTGVSDSVFSFMYIFAVLLGALEAHLAGGLGWSILSAAAYAGLLYMHATGMVVPPYGGTGAYPANLTEIVWPIVNNGIGFILVGGLAGTLSEEIRKASLRAMAHEDSLRELESFNQYVVANIPSGIVTTDMAGKVLLMNDAACSILGISHGYAEGRSLADMFGGKDPFPGGTSSRLSRPEATVTRPDGTEAFLGFSSSLLRGAAGAILGRVVIFQDLTPARMMEERVRIADRLAAVGELAASLAHEVRNPLASIAGSTQILMESPGLPDEHRTLLEIIGKESTRLNRLIGDFLSYTRVDARTSGPVPLGEIAAEVAEAVKAGEARESGVFVEKAESCALMVDGDAEKLRQVVWNLVRNAIQASPPGGTVRVGLSRRERMGERFAVLTVRDEGAGIDSGILAKIYNPFFTTKEGGTGLGLAISQRIVHSHKGFVELQTGAGMGTEFSVWIPESPSSDGAADV